MLGLTGGIAGGKSAAAARLRELGAFVADADRIARDIMADETVLNAVRERFGPEVFTSEGALDRRALAVAAFSTTEGTEALNAITHPAIKARLLEEAAAAERSGEYPLAVIDVPLLVESGLHEACSSVWLVTADIETRLKRVMQRDGLTREEALLRISRQLPDEEKAKYASTVIVNDGSLSELRAKTDHAFAKELLKQMGESHGR